MYSEMRYAVVEVEVETGEVLRCCAVFSSYDMAEHSCVYMNRDNEDPTVEYYVENNEGY